MVRTAVRRCLGDHYWGELQRLLETGQVSARSTPELLPTLMAQSQLELLQMCLVHVHDVPEKELISLVRFLLNHDWGTAARSASSGKRSKEPKRKAQGEGAAAGSPASLAEPLEQMLCLVVARPRNDAALLRSLRSLPIVNAVVLLQFFHTRLQNLSREDDQPQSEREKPKKTRGGSARAELSAPQARGGAGGSSPSFAQVLDWTMLLLDAHFAGLLVIPSCHALLSELSRSVADHSDLAQLLAPLKGILAHFRECCRTSRLICCVICCPH